jgi:hypothetical protein
MTYLAEPGEQQAAPLQPSGETRSSWILAPLLELLELLVLLELLFRKSIKELVDA